jgi:hypothetical protein
MGVQPMPMSVDQFDKFFRDDRDNREMAKDQSRTNQLIGAVHRALCLSPQQPGSIFVR